MGVSVLILVCIVLVLIMIYRIRRAKSLRQGTFYIHTLLYKSLLDTVQHQVITGISQYENITNYHQIRDEHMYYIRYDILLTNNSVWMAKKYQNSILYLPFIQLRL